MVNQVNEASETSGFRLKKTQGLPYQLLMAKPRPKPLTSKLRETSRNLEGNCGETPLSKKANRK
jgi:hypothetical protein